MEKAEDVDHLSCRSDVDTCLRLIRIRQHAQTHVSLRDELLENICERSAGVRGLVAESLPPILIPGLSVILFWLLASCFRSAFWWSIRRLRRGIRGLDFFAEFFADVAFRSENPFVRYFD